MPDAQHYDVFAFPRELTWFHLLETHVLAKSEDIVVYLARVADKEDHVTLPLIRHRAARYGGRCLSALQNFYTPDYRPLCSTRGAAAEHIGALVDAWWLQSRQMSISLSPLDPSAPETAALQCASRQMALRCKAVLLLSTGYTTLRVVMSNILRNVQSVYKTR